MADTSGERPRATAPDPVDTANSTINGARHGHEQLPFVQPSTFLQPRLPIRAMPDKPITQTDKDQQAGLVSATFHSPSPTLFATSAFCEMTGCNSHG